MLMRRIFSTSVILLTACEMDSKQKIASRNLLSRPFSASAFTISCMLLSEPHEQMEFVSPSASPVRLMTISANSNGTLTFKSKAVDKRFYILLWFFRTWDECLAWARSAKLPDSTRHPLMISVSTINTLLQKRVLPGRLMSGIWALAAKYDSKHIARQRWWWVHLAIRCLLNICRSATFKTGRSGVIHCVSSVRYMNMSKKKPSTTLWTEINRIPTHWKEIKVTVTGVVVEYWSIHLSSSVARRLEARGGSNTPFHSILKAGCCLSTRTPNSETNVEANELWGKRKLDECSALEWSSQQLLWLTTEKLSFQSWIEE